MQVLVTNYYEARNEELKPVAVQKHKAARFTLEHVSSDTEPSRRDTIIKTIRGVLNAWREIMERRQKASEALQLPFEQFNTDYKVAVGYVNLVESTDDNVVELTKKSGNKGRHIMVLADCDGQIQAIATLKARVDRIDVDTIISAPWNVPMQSEVQPEHKKLRVAGAGKTMIRQVYELAKAKGKLKIQMRPIETARSFYVDTLKMITEEGRSDVHFLVSQKDCPETLQVPSGNLLEIPK